MELELDSTLEVFRGRLDDLFHGVARIVYSRREETVEPEKGPSIEEAGLPKPLVDALHRRGIKRLYRFQWEAIKSILDGYNTVIVSGTGTGKTEAFLIPVIAQCLEKPDVRPRALVLYPTKALARDQFQRIQELLGYSGAYATVYDGDTPARDRRRIGLNPPQILVTNPDMLHIGLVFSPYIRRMARRVDYVVVDEMHVYEGVFGAHVRAVVERLKVFTKKKLLFIGSSATVGNPERHGETLFGEKVRVVRGPPMRRGVAYHVMVSSGYLSRWTVAAGVASILASMGLRVLVFTDSQQMAEVLARIIRRSYGREFLVHRAGLSPLERRVVETKLSRGEVDGVVATPTLELGIDIGYLDAVVMASPPPSYAKYLQRAGRAGRRGRTGYVFLVLGDDPIDSYFESNPVEYYRQEVPPVYLEPGNEEVLRIHALALLVQQGYVYRRLGISSEWFRALDKLVSEGLAVKTGYLYHPVPRVSRRELLKYKTIRGCGPQVSIVDYSSREAIGYRELPMALLDLHPNAIYLHSGRVYRSLGIDIGRRIAFVERISDDTPYYTRPLYTTDLLEYSIVMERISRSGVPLAYADTVISITLVGYTVYSIYSTSKPTRIEYLEKPITYSYKTKALLLKYPVNPEWSMMENAEAFHAIEHVLITAARPVCGASLGEMGGISYPSGDIVVYDGAHGGSGLARLLYERFEKAEELAYKIVSNCKCIDGCPRCVYSPYCGNNNKVLSRRKAEYILYKVLYGREEIQEKPCSKRYGEPIA